MFCHHRQTERFGTNGDGAAIFDVEEISELVRIFSFTLNGTDRTVFTSE